MRKETDKRRVAVLALPEVVAFDLATPLQVFGHRAEAAHYRARLCAQAAGPVPTTTGFTVEAAYGLDALAEADTVIVPGFESQEPVSVEVVNALRTAHRRGARIASICTGAFALAASGLLDNRPATTHWQCADKLARRYPSVRVDPQVLYIDDDDILTSAGVAAGIDLCLHMLRSDRGEAAAIAASRRLVAPLHRAGGQAQYIAHAEAEVPEHLVAALDWARAHLDQQLPVTTLARRALMSPRTFHRAVKSHFSTGPHEWITRQRLQKACALLEDPTVPIDEVARLSGLGTAANLRLHFRRAYTTSPSAYRASFNS